MARLHLECFATGSVAISHPVLKVWESMELYMIQGSSASANQGDRPCHNSTLSKEARKKGDADRVLTEVLFVPVQVVGLRISFVLSRIYVLMNLVLPAILYPTIPMSPRWYLTSIDTRLPTKIPPLATTLRTS